MPTSSATKRRQEGENRVVTVLFVDICDFVRVTRDIAPEEAKALVSRAMRRMEDVVLELGGTVRNFLGDGLLAVFGLETAHEDDPERAIAAALQIREEIHGILVGREALEVSAGINTGEVCFDRIDMSDLPQHVIGLVVNLASRLEGVAGRGEILVGPSTHRWAQGAFEFTERVTAIKGLADPVTLYRVERALPDPRKVRGIPGLRPRMVGRDGELAQLRAAYGRALIAGGQLVILAGDAGVGKSRLLEEFHREIAGTGQEGALWLEGRCEEMSRGLRFGPIQRLLHGFLRDSAAGDASGFLRSLARSGLMQPPASAPHERPGVYLAHLLGLELEPADRERLAGYPPQDLMAQTFQAVRRLLEELFRPGRRGVAVLEDLHWADSLTFDLISYLMDGLARIPFLLICVYRPEPGNSCLQLRDLAQLKCSDSTTYIELTDLHAASVRELLEALLPDNRIPEETKDWILGKSRGNPLFLEEIVSALIESGYLSREGEAWCAREGIDDCLVPGTVQNLILSRLDRLSPECRHVVRAAAVIGQRFPRSLLASLVDLDARLEPALASLVDRGFIIKESALPEEIYSFKHFLTRDAVYRNILKSTRQQMHHETAERLRALHAPNLEEHCEELSYHYSQAGRAREAVEFLIRSGDRAARMYANREAVEAYRRSLTFLESLADAPDRRQIERGVRGRLGDGLFLIGRHAEAEAEFRGALRIESPDAGATATAALEWKLADAVHWQNRFDEALAIAGAALERTASGPPTPELANLLEVSMRSHWAKDDWPAARAIAQKLALILPEVPYFERVYSIYYALAWQEIVYCNFDAARAWLARMEAVSLERGNERGLARCYHGMGDLARATRDYECAIRFFEKSLEHSQRVGDAHLLLEGHLELAHLYIMTDRAQSEIDDHVQAGTRVAEEMGRERSVASLSSLCMILGNAYLDRNELDRAEIYLRRSLDFANPAIACRALCLLEQTLARGGRASEFRAFCDGLVADSGSGRISASFRFLYLRPGAPDARFGTECFADDLADGPLEPGWVEAPREAGTPAAGSVAAGAIEVSAGPGQNIALARSSAPRLLRSAAGAFAVEVSLFDLEGPARRSGGLILWQSAEQLVVFGKMSPLGDDLRLELRRHGHHELVGRGCLAGAALRLRLERAGDRVRALCAPERGAWQECGECELELADPLWVGLFVTCPSGYPECTGRFRLFRFLREGVG